MSIYLIKIGHLLPFIVLKSRPGSKPGHGSYLVKILESPLLATLPKQLAIKNYHNEDTGLAAIQEMNGPRITLSQRTPFYVRKMLEHLLADALKKHQLKIKHIGTSKGMPYYKVAVESLSKDITTNKDIRSVLKPYLAKIDLTEHFGRSLFSFVKYSKDIKEYVINALFPSTPPDIFYEINYDENLKKISILIDSNKTGTILWTSADEVALAQKLCGVEIEINKINTK